jgi:hypothetical protein
MFVVNKGDIMSDKDIVFDLDPLADKGVARDLNVLSDLGVLLYLDESANLTVVSDGAAVKIDKSEDTHTGAKFNIWSDATEFC